MRMSGQIMFLDCPAYLDAEGDVRCGLPAAISCRFVMSSTDGPLECAMIRCPSGHFFNGPVEFLGCDKQESTADNQIRRSQPADREGTRPGTPTPT
jgi:hypothetical protein